MSTTASETASPATFNAMGGTVEVQGAAPADVRRIAILFERYEQACSRFRPDSELCALNAAAGSWFAASPLLTRLVRESLRWREATGGVFDPTTLDALEAAGYDRTWPFDAPISRAARTASPRAATAGTVEVADDGRIRLAPGVRIDLGGIAKGFAVDRAIEALRDCRMDIPRGGLLVNASGDLYAAGDAPGAASGEGWLIGVHHPRTPEADDIDVALLRVRDRGVATSGSIRRRWLTPGGERYHHLIDARTGLPFDSDLLTITVVARSTTAADVLATTGFLLGTSGLDAIQRLGGEALAVTTEGEVLMTAGMPDYLA